MSKLIKSADGYVWMDVTEKALNVWETGIFEMHDLISIGNNVITSKIHNIEELSRASQLGHSICIPVGKLSESNSVGFLVSTTWDTADKITHEGHVYIRAKDILFI